jgi:hypothetical protein
MNPFMMGYYAYFNGLDPEDNPFNDDFTPLGYEDWEDWDDGWWEAWDEDNCC